MMQSVPPPGVLEHDSATSPAPDRAPDEPPWAAWTAPAAIALGLALGVMMSILVGAAARAGGSSLRHPTPAVNLIADVLFDLAFVMAAIYFAGLRQRPRPSDFGFRRVRPRLAAGAVLAGGIGYYVLSAIYASLLNLHGNEKLPSEFGVDKSTAALVAATVFVCVLAPIAEEFFFRGFLFGALRRWRIQIAGHHIGAWVAAIVTGILFGLAHSGSASSRYLVPLGLLGFILGLLRWRTGSLYPCMALHSLNNSLALGINQLHWSLGEIVALIVVSIAVISAATAPLALRAPAIA